MRYLEVIIDKKDGFQLKEIYNINNSNFLPTQQEVINKYFHLDDVKNINTRFIESYEK